MKDGRDHPVDFEADDAGLWNLLGKVPAPRVSPYFARRVLREVVRLEEEGAAPRRWLRRLVAGWGLPRAAWSGAAAVALVGLASWSVAGRHGHLTTHRSVATALPREEISPQDVEVIANLDNLMAFEENKIWTDESNAD